MVQPQPHKLTCPECNYSKIVSPKSDALGINDFITNCPKCGESMKRTTPNVLDHFISKIFRG